MATPHVSATAAMLRKAGDGIAYARIRNLILDNVDRKGAFSSTNHGRAAQRGAGARGPLRRG